MDFLLENLPLLIPLSLIAVFLFSLPTGMEILRHGNDADPLGREIEEERRRQAEQEGERAA